MPQGAIAGRLVLLSLAGFSLRVTVLALPPVLIELARSLGLGGGGVGLVTATPSLLFALLALPAAWLIGRMGVLPCLLIGMGVTAAGSALRAPATGLAWLCGATAIMSGGIAMAQTALPALARSWAPGRVGLATATYTFGLLLGEIAPNALVITARLPPAPAGWPSQLLAWSVPVAAAAVAVAVWRPRTSHAPREPSPVRPDWSDPMVWRVGVLLGAVNAIYFALNGFIPSWLGSAGLAGSVQPTLLALNLAQLPAAFLMMRFADRLVGSAWTYILVAVGLAAGALALRLAPSAAPVATAAATGFLLALLLALALTIPPLLAEERRVASLTAATFTVGYGLAVVATVAIGWLDRSGPRWLSVAPVAVSALGVLVLGPPAARAVAAACSQRR